MNPFDFERGRQEFFEMFRDAFFEVWGDILAEWEKQRDPAMYRQNQLQLFHEEFAGIVQVRR